MSTVDTALIEAYLANVHMALDNLDVSHAAILLERAQKLLAAPHVPLPLPSVQVTVGVGLDAGTLRKHKPNEDFAFATTGVNVHTQETYTLQLIADGMGGHAQGQLASRLAGEAIVDTLLPQLHHEHVQSSNLGELLVRAVTHANAIICAHNEEVVSSNPFDQMGTTITVVATMGPHASIANVGDSRAYLYRPGTGLRSITRDHSVVADLVASGAIAPDDIYTHPERNKILRSLGYTPAIQVDLFSELLQNGDIFLLCSDGMWEMTRDAHMEQILAFPLSIDTMTEHLVHLALKGGGRDNIGVVVSQFLLNVVAMQTVLISPLPYYAAAAS